MKCQSYSCKGVAVALTESDSPFGDARPLWRCQKCIDAMVEDERTLEAANRDGSRSGRIYHIKIVKRMIG